MTSYIVSIEDLTIYVTDDIGGEVFDLNAEGEPITPQSDEFEGLHALARFVGELREQGAFDLTTAHVLKEEIRDEAEARGLVPSREKEREAVERAIEWSFHS